MANLRITRLGHGGVLYRSPEDAWIWVDRWTGAPNYADAYRTPEKVSVAVPPRRTSTGGVRGSSIDRHRLPEARRASRRLRSVAQ